MASLLTIGHLNLLALVTSLARPYGDFRRRKKVMGSGGLLKRGKGKSIGRGEHHWIFSDVL